MPMVNSQYPVSISGQGQGQYPMFQFAAPSALPQNPDFNSIMSLIQSAPQSLYNAAIPQVANVLGQASPYLEPQIAAIRQAGEAGAARAQSDSMARGLTGSDIEAAAMYAPRAGAEQNVAQVRGAFAMQAAQQLAAMIMQALGVDINSNQEMFYQLAQAAGQELTAQRDMDMFNQQQSSARRAMMMNALGQIGGSAISAGFGLAGTNKLAGAIQGLKAGPGMPGAQPVP